MSVTSPENLMAATPEDALHQPDAPDTTPDVVDGMAFAKLYGEPLFALPQDLYIPPDAQGGND